ncbi:MAG TPA: hypothetical protein VKR30_09335 [Candidatus Limnocylindrales bacterium]|nr:hypothetical protein [Candidatus Limnocylindrales bacterium]
MTVAGDANVTGTWGPSFGVTCDNPSFAGPDIIFFGQSPDAKAVVLIALMAGSIGVSERAGSGANYTDREFKGTGVSAFDPATGGTFDSDVSEVVQPNAKPGTLGKISHVTGSIDCGGQTAGASTVTVTGSTADGAVSGPFSSFRVQCNSSAQYGRSVGMTGIITIGSNPTLMIITLPSANPNGGVIFSVGDNPATNHTYKLDPAGTLSVTATGAHIDADFVEVLAGGAAGPHRIHLAGDVTCGTIVSS